MVLYAIWQALGPNVQNIIQDAIADYGRAVVDGLIDELGLRTAESVADYVTDPSFHQALAKHTRMPTHKYWFKKKAGPQYRGKKRPYDWRSTAYGYSYTGKSANPKWAPIHKHGWKWSPTQIKGGSLDDWYTASRGFYPQKVNIYVDGQWKSATVWTMSRNPTQRELLDRAKMQLGYPVGAIEEINRIGQKSLPLKVPGQKIPTTTLQTLHKPRKKMPGYYNRSAYRSGYRGKNMVHWQGRYALIGGRKRRKLYIPKSLRFVPERALVRLSTFHPYIHTTTIQSAGNTASLPTYRIPAAAFKNSAVGSVADAKLIGDIDSDFLHFQVIANSVLDQQGYGSDPTGVADIRIPRPGGLETFSRLYETCRVHTCKSTWRLRLNATTTNNPSELPVLFVLLTADDNNTDPPKTVYQDLKERRIEFPHFKKKIWRPQMNVGANTSNNFTAGAMRANQLKLEYCSIKTKVMTGLAHHETAEMEPEELIQLLPEETGTTWKHTDAAADTGPIRKVYHNLWIQQIEGSTTIDIHAQLFVEQYVEFFNPRDIADNDFGAFV